MEPPIRTPSIITLSRDIIIGTLLEVAGLLRYSYMFLSQLYNSNVMCAPRQLQRVREKADGGAT
jgi:hypothetical protein